MEIFMKLKGKLVQYDATQVVLGLALQGVGESLLDMLRRRKIRQDKETDDLEECAAGASGP